MKKKKIFVFFAAVFLIYAFWLAQQLFRFQKYTDTPAAPDSLEIRGTYHIHTRYSDGKKNPAEIARIASRSSLDFVILTDHGNPNHECLAAAGWKDRVLVLSGSELSVSRGHLVALGFKTPSTPFSQKTEHAVYEIKAQNGFSIIAHPYSKVSWSWGEFVDYSGIEIINVNTMFKKDMLHLLPYAPCFLIKPDFVLIKMLKRPEKNLRKWDELNHLHPLFAYYSTDAHFFYEPLLPVLNLHVLLHSPLSSDFEEASHQVFTALKSGRFYNAVDAAAQARGFRFWIQKDDQKLNMGEEAVIDSPLSVHIQAPFSFSTEIHLIHNGEKIHSSLSDHSSYETQKPGFYRVEVYLKERSPLHEDMPWIVSNPIFLREKRP